MMSNELFPLRTDQPKAKDLKNIFSHYTKYWYLFVLGIVLTVGIAFCYLRYLAVPKYEITSTILIKDENSTPVISSNSGLGELNMKGSTEDLNNEIEVLKSRSLMERVVSELSLFTSYYIEGRVRDVEVYGKLSPINLVIGNLDSTAFGKKVTVHLKPNNLYELREDDKNVTIHKLGELVHKSYGTFTIIANPVSLANNSLFDKNIFVVFHDIRQVADGLNNAIEIAPISKEATVLMVSLEDAVPQRGKDIINKLINIYDKEALEYKNRNAANTVDFLDERLKFVTSELSGVEKQEEKYKKQNDVADISSQAGNYIEQASTYNKQLSDWAIQIDVLESIERYLNLNKNTNQSSMVPSTLGIQDPTLLSLIEKFNNLQLERERLLRTSEVGSPLVQNINEQLGNLRTNILENLQNIKKGLLITSRNLKASSGQFQSQIRKVPSIERELLEINRDKEIKKELYSYLLQKREESALALAGSASSSRIIDPAISSDYPIAPNKQVIYLLSVLLGLIIPFTGIYIKDLLNNKIQTVEDVENLTNTPILGELVYNTNNNVLVVAKDNHSPIAEMFRLIRANLLFTLKDQESKVLLVTSSMSGEGKTFFSINFSSSLLLTGKKVVLLELDLRNSDLSYLLGVEEGTIGITDYLTSDNLIINDVVSESVRIPGLHFISSGPVPVNPSELMMSSKLAYLISELRENFDYIVLDTAPVGKVADVFSLAPLIDATVYMTRCNYTYKSMLTTIDNIYKYAKLKNPMIVVNGAKKENSHTYGYGYEKKNYSKKKVVI